MKLFTIQEGVKALRNEEVIAYPTEAVYGLGCDPWSEKGVAKLLAIKGRTPQKGIIVIAADLEMLFSVIDKTQLTGVQLEKLATPTIYPTTWVVPFNSDCPAWLYGAHHSIAVRISSHPVCKALCLEWGKPIVSTSANLSGEPAITTLDEVLQVFKNDIGGVVEGALGGLSAPSRIIDLISGAVLRG